MRNPFAKRREPAEPPLVCAFCGKDQPAVRALIAGPSVMICDECIVLSLGVLESTPNRHRRFEGELVLEALLGRLEGAPADGAVAVHEEAALAYAASAPEAARMVLERALATGRHGLARRAFERLAEEDRTVDDALHGGLALHAVGELEEAREVFEELDPDLPEEAAQRDAHLVATRLRLERNLDVVQLERMLRAVEAATDALADPTPWIRDALETSKAELLIRLGSAGHGETVLRKLVADTEPTPLQRMLLADALLARGERARARREYAKAAQNAEGFLKIELEERRGKADATPYR